MSTHPYIPLYVDDYDAHTSHLSPAEDGVYMRLLRLCWRTPGCSLPDDPAWIARKIRLSADQYEEIAKPVLEEFFKLSRGRLVQKRLKGEYDDISRKKLARQKAGKIGGDAKARKTQGKPASNATDLPAHTRAFPEPEPKPDKSSEDKSSGVEADAAKVVEIKPAEAVDLNAEAWRLGVNVLVSQGGMAEKSARTYFGGLLKGIQARDLMPAISQAALAATKDPQGYLYRAAHRLKGKGPSPALEPQRVGFV